MLRTALLPLIAAAFAAGAAAPAAQAAKPPKAVGHVITVGQGIGALKLGLTEEGVRQMLGRPRSTFRADGRLIRMNYERKYHLSLLFELDPGKPAVVVVIDVLRGGGYRTREGLRIGSKLSRVRNVYPAARCGLLSGGTKDDELCNVGTGAGGAVAADGFGSTSFIARKGKLRKIEIGA